MSIETERYTSKTPITIGDFRDFCGRHNQSADNPLVIEVWSEDFEKSEFVVKELAYAKGVVRLVLSNDTGETE